ncbi:DUF6090 family protein [Lacinutrix iliipiscaria]|uniref:DUF6090 family protein n=1 Tax=Lacinutrix iliipiscaria TaxID=1230532 RepID=A0ABW5WRD4_9FLAO
MIKFFRKIRRNLLSEGKTGKYLKYAIGEIVLVVVGILIALAINNWNETRKTKSTLSNYTESLIKDLKQDIIILNEQTDFAISDNKILQNLIERLSSPNVNNDSLIKIVRNELPTDFKTFRPLNSKTLLAIQSNGILEYYDDITYDYLIDLQTVQTIRSDIIKIQINNHNLQFQEMMKKYSIGEYKALSGPLAENAWSRIDSDDLYRSFESYITSRKWMNDKGNINRELIMAATEKVLNRLIEMQ